MLGMMHLKAFKVTPVSLPGAKRRPIKAQVLLIATVAVVLQKALYFCL